MLHKWVSDLYRLSRGSPGFQVYGKGRTERRFFTIDIYCTPLRNWDSGIPLFAGVCITWTDRIISVGVDFALALLHEQQIEPASRDYPVEVAAQRLSDSSRRRKIHAPSWPSYSEVMAHECGHTAQARRMGGLYWLIGGALTLCREGPHWWNEFENQASEGGIFGGIVPGSVDYGLWRESLEIGNRPGRTES
jgi:hypothetical protein